MRNTIKSRSDGSDEKQRLKSPDGFGTVRHEGKSALQFPVFRLTLTKRPSRCARPSRHPRKQKRGSGSRPTGQGTNSPLPARQHSGARSRPCRRGGRTPGRRESPPGRGRAESAALGRSGRAESRGAEQTNARRSRNPAAPPPPARSGRNARGSTCTAAPRLTSAASRPPPPPPPPPHAGPGRVAPALPRQSCDGAGGTSGTGSAPAPGRAGPREGSGCGLRPAGRPAHTSCTPSAEGRRRAARERRVLPARCRVLWRGRRGPRFASLRGIPPNKKGWQSREGWETAMMYPFRCSFARGELLGGHIVPVVLRALQYPGRGL